MDRRLEEVAKAVGGGYCRLQMAFAARATVAGHRLGALERAGRVPPHSNALLCLARCTSADELASALDPHKTGSGILWATLVGHDIVQPKCVVRTQLALRLVYRMLCSSTWST